MVLNTPAANERVRREAENIYRASSARRSTRPREFKFASIAKDLYTQMGFALINETPEIILKTEELVSQMYDEGIGAEDDAEKLDGELSHVAAALVGFWDDFSDSLPQPEGEHEVEIGPPLESDDFQKAAYLAHLVLQIHYSRFMSQQADGKVPPLPEILFMWMQQRHNPFPDQLADVLRFRPSPACHSLYWQALGSALIRGEVAGAANLLRKAGWDKVRTGTRGEYKFTGKALENVQRAVDATCDMLESCPAVNGNWDISRDEVDASQSAGLRGQRSLAGLAREAGSQVPWEIYQHLQNGYDIVLGSHQAIIETAQDWCEATIGLFGWWDEGKERHNKSLRLSRSQSTRISTNFGGPNTYEDRLAHAIHTVVESDFHFNAMNPVEVALASTFEGNYTAVIGILRAWSLPVAAAMAELAALGQWLPKPERRTNLLMDALDEDDLEVLGMNVQGPDELDGIKDTTLLHYARELAGIEQVSRQRDGWEIAIQVLGRMDSVKRSEEMVGELLKELLDRLDVNSNETGDRMWRILNDLGMIRYAEDTAEVWCRYFLVGSHDLTCLRLLQIFWQTRRTDTARLFGITPSRIGLQKWSKCALYSSRTLSFSQRHIRQLARWTIT
jgi:Nup85 Nucleoporin